MQNQGLGRLASDIFFTESAIKNKPNNQQFLLPKYYKIR